MSETLFIPQHMVNNHFRSIFEKTGVNSRRQMVQRLYLQEPMPGLLSE